MKLLVLALLIASCASHLPGTKAQEINPIDSSKPKPELEISIDALPELSSDQYQAFLISFLNNTNTWIRLEALNLRFPALAMQPSFLLGKDLETYLIAITRRNALQNENTRAAVLAIGLIGGGIGLSSPQSSLGDIGAGIMVGALSYGTVQELIQSKKRSEFHTALPDNHVLRPFDVPPGLSMSRWVVIQLQKGEFFKEVSIEVQRKDRELQSFTAFDQSYLTKVAWEEERSAKLKRLMK